MSGLLKRLIASCLWIAAGLSSFETRGAIIYFEGFENGLANWTVDAGLWHAGPPKAANGPAAFAGEAVAGTGLTNNYGATHDTRLISPELAVPGAGESPRLTYHYWYAIGANDYGQLQIREPGGEWQDIPGERLSEASGGSWARRSVDLRGYAGKTVQVAFRLFARANNSAGELALGWFIDEVKLETGPTLLTPQTFENGFGDWSAEGGVWQVGRPFGAGAPAPFAGTNVAGTILGGIYGTTHDSRLVTPEFVVPPASEAPRFAYHYWYEIGVNDYGQLQVREVGGDWQDIAGETLTEANGGSWARRSVDLRAFAGKAIQIGFRLVAAYGNRAGDLALGWYIDDARLETGATTLAGVESFENGFGNWSAEGGVWQVGRPSGAGAPAPFAGTNVAGTILGGIYGTTHDSRLVTPEFVVPPASEAPRFAYHYWYEIGVNDYGQLQVREVGGDWQDIAGETLTEASGGSWARRSVDLRAFAGKTIQIGFRLVAAYGNRVGDLALGWYIDDARLETGATTLAGVESFENGFGNWSAEGGVWQVGIPSGAGAPTAFHGQNLAGTILEGNYGTTHDARLVSPEFVVPTAEQNPRFTYFYWYAIGGLDYGQLQIREVGADWQDIPGERLTESGGGWARGSVDLRNFGGKAVQIAFRLVSIYQNRAGDFGLGWYVDYVALETGPHPFEAREGFEAGFAGWSAEGGIWQVGTPSGAGAPSPFSGQRVAGTVLGVNYGTIHDARLVSPEFIVPSAGNNPRFSYWYWYDLGFLDSGQLQIRVEGGGWQDVPGERLAERGLVWARRSLDLRAYAGRKVQIGFRFVSGYENRAGDFGRGWYIDEAALETGPAEFDGFEDFERGFAHWSAEGGVWQVGRASGAGAPALRSGTNVAGTIIGGTYPNNTDARLVSPEFVVPPAARAPQLGFQQWRAMTGNDRGRVEISVAGGGWQPLSEFFSGLDASWKRHAVDLSPFAGRPVRIGWRFTSDAFTVNRGWYIEDVEVSTLDPVALAPNGSTNGVLTVSGSRALYVIEVPGGGHLRLNLDNADNTGLNVVYLRRGALPTAGVYDFRTARTGSDQSIFVPDAGSGPWFALVVGAYVPTNSSPYVLRSEFFPGVFLTGVSPSPVGNAYPAVLEVNGAGFDSTVGVDLRAGASVLASGTATVIRSDRLRADFADLKHVAAGTYQLTVTKGTNSSFLPLEIVEGGVPRLETELIVPGRLGRHAPAIIYVEYANTGTAAMPAPLLIVHGTERPLLTLSSSAGARGLWTGTRPASFANTMPVLGSGASPGLLQPGERRRVPVYYSGLQTPWNMNRTGLSFDLGIVDAANATPVDWDSLKARLKPGHIDPEGWNVLWANFLRSVGSTWGSFAARLVDRAQVFGNLGLNVADFSELLASEIIHADGLNPVYVLAEATDAFVAQPGVPLTVVRYYLPPITQRYRSGPLGRGWRHNWEFKATPSAGGVVNVATPSGGVRVFEPDLRGGFFSQPGDDGKLTSQSLGRYELREKNGVKSVFRFDGMLESIEDLNGNRVSANYNSDQTLRSLSHSAGQSLEFTYAGGLLQSVTDSLGRTTRLQYGSGHLTQVISPDGTTTGYEYDGHSLTAMNYAEGRRNSFRYDSQGRLAGMGRNGLGEVSFTYDATGALVMTDAENKRGKVHFDHRGIPIRVEAPDGTQARLAFDQNFRLTALEGSEISPLRCTFDARGNLIRLVDPNGRSTSFAYDAANRASVLIDPRNQKTTFAHDAKGNLLTIKFGDESERQFAYNPNGVVTNIVNRRKQATALQRDGSGRLVRKTSAGGRVIDYHYDSRGNLTNVTDSALGVIALEYDGRDLLTRITHPGGRGFSFQYDSAGRRTVRRSHDGHVLSYFYDGTGRLDRLEDGAKRLVRYQYDTLGRLVREDKGNATWTTYDYNGVGLLSRVTNFDRSGAPLSRFEYQFDRAGRCVALDTLGGTSRFQYDAAQQLTQVDHADGRTTRYTYDPVGNRMAAFENSTNTVYSVNNLNQYTRAGDATFGYDADGNLLQRQEAVGTATYEYDDENRLIRVTTPAGTWEYTYNGLGQRVAVSGGGATAHFLYDVTGSSDLAAEYRESGELVARFDYGTGLLARTDGAGNSFFYNFDGTGNTREITDPQGVPVNRYEYEPFGATTANASAVPNPFTFAGRAGVLQDGTGLHHMRARSYDSRLGRFMQVDPQGLRVSKNPSIYTYVSNNPITRFDPLGLAEEEPLIHWDPFKGQGNPGWTTISDDLKGIDIGINILDPWLALRGGFEGFRSFLGPLGQVVGARDALYYGGNGDIRGMYEKVKFVTLMIPQLALGAIFPQGAPLIGAGIGLFGETVWEVWTDIIGNIYLYIGQGLGWLSDRIPWDKLRTLRNQIAAAFDPNELIGPAGHGQSNYLAGDQTFSYRINFENATNATAPAQMVVITNALPPNLDLATLEFTSAGFGDQFFEIPSGSQHHEQTERMTFNNTEFDVHIEAKVLYDTRQVQVKFESVMPETGLPPEVDVGFLPPEDSTGRGQGHVAYVIRPNSGLPTGTEIRNIGLITFDPFAGGPTFRTDLTDPTNPASPPNPNRQALVTIDADAPLATVNALPASSSGAGITVTWGGTDSGAGIETYTVYARTAGSDWTLWQDATPGSSAVWAGEAGQTYSFYAIATDFAGLAGLPPSTGSTPQASTTATGLSNYFRAVSLTGQTVVLEFSATAQERWLIERAPVLSGPWSGIGEVTIPAGGVGQFSEIRSQGNSFYRAVRK